MLRILHSLSVAGADTEAVVVAAELIAAEVVACTAAAVRRVTLRAAWAPMDVAAACMAAVDRMACMAERVRTE